MATAMSVLADSYEQDFTECEETFARDEVQQGVGLLLQSQREELEAEVEQAETLVVEHPSLGGEEGGYSAETMGRAIAFLKAHVERAWRSHGTKAPIPTIGPGPEGSIDLYWKQPSWKLLVNVPADKDSPATFYGDDYGRQKTRGTLDLDKISVAIIAWLMT